MNKGKRRERERDNVLILSRLDLGIFKYYNRGLIKEREREVVDRTGRVERE